MLTKNSISLILVIALMFLFVSCGASVPELTENFNGEHFNFSYPDGWDVIEEELNVKLVYEGIMLQFDIIEDDTFTYGDFGSVKTVISATVSDSDPLKDENISLPIATEDDNSKLETKTRWIEIKNKEGKGIFLFTPIDGAISIVKLQPGKYANIDYKTAIAILETFEQKTLAWTPAEPPPAEWTLETLKSEFWSIQYLSNWTIEKSERETQFFDEDGNNLVTIQIIDLPNSNPESSDSILDFVSEKAGNNPHAPVTNGNFAYTINFIDTNNNSETERHFSPAKGQVIMMTTTEFIDKETANTILASFTYDADNDPGVVINTDTSIPADNSDNQINEPPDTNNSSSNVKKGETVNNDKFKITLPAGWTFEKQTEMAYFVNPPDKSSGTSILIEVQPAASFSGLSISEIHELFKSSLDNVSDSAPAELGNVDALSYIITENGTTQIFTTYINDRYYYVVKLIVGNVDYSAEYEAFLKWFQTK